MKNFFKKLAFVLALAMVVTAFAPAAQASAAKAPTLSTTSKKLYLGGDKSGKYEDKFTLKVWNKGDYSVTFASDNTAVATVSKWYGVVEAKAVGTATITATVSNKETKKVVNTLSAKVYVKKNATSVALGSLAKFDEPLAVGDKVKVNVARKAGDVAVWKQADKDKITDYVVWTSSNTDVAKVDKWGTVTAVAPGEATISAVAMQIEGKVATTEAKSFKVVVKGGIKSVSQKNVTTANVDLAVAVTDKEFNKDSLKVSALVGSTKVAQVVKSVAIDSKDATKATVELYVGFSKDTVYTFEYNDTTAEFIGADTSADAVDSIKITTTEAVKGEATEIKYQLLTVNGVDITSAISGRVTLSTTSNDAYLDTASNSITFFETGKVAEVTAEFHTYKYDETTGKELSKKAVAAITSVDAKTYELGNVKAWTLDSDGDFNFDKDTVNQKLSLSEKTNGVYLIARFIKNDTDKTKVLTVENKALAGKFTYESSNNNVVVVAGAKLYPVNTGSATIIIKNDGKAVDAITVTVLPERKAASLTITVDKTYISLNKAFDIATVKFEVKDQLDSKFENNKVDVLLLSTPADGKLVGLPYTTSAATEVTGELKLQGDNFDKEGTYQFKVTAGDITKVFAIVVKEAKSVSGQKLELSAKEVDTTLKLTTAADKNKNKDVTITLYDVDASGVKVNKIDASKLYYTKADAKAAIVGNGSNYYYEIIDTDGKLVAASSKVVDTTADKFVPLTVSGTALSKVKAGTYKVAAYELTVKDSKETVRAIGVDFIVVKDAQPKASVEQKRVKASDSTVLGALNADDIVIKLFIDQDDESKEIQKLVAVKELIGATGSGNTVYLKSVEYTHTIDYAGTSYQYTQTIEVNKTLELK